MSKRKLTADEGATSTDVTQLTPDSIATTKLEGGISVFGDKDTVCCACLSGEVYEDDEILFCDSCNMAAHQSCYGIETIPPGFWYCDPCKAKIDPSTLNCVFCSNVGGAYKRVENSDKWIHSLCFLCTPELYCVNNADSYTVSIDYLDAKRSKIRCSLCKAPGSCIQCSYGRCAVAAHPWCLLHTPQGCAHKWDDSKNFFMFCQQHAAFKDGTPSMVTEEGSLSPSEINGDKIGSKTLNNKLTRSAKSKQTKESDGAAGETNTGFVGRVILRDFGKHGYFMGYVRSYSDPYYLVEYPIDGDSEEMTEAQILPLLLRGDK